MITIKDLSDYDKIKGLNETIDKGYPMVKKTIDGGLYERNDNAKRIVDTWIKKANALLAQQTKEEKKEPKAEPKSEKPSEKPTKKPKTKDSDKPKKQSKPQKEKKDEKPKTSGSKRKKRTSTAKTETKTEKKKDETAKTSKSKKEGKPKVGEPEPWQVTLRYFATYCCGKEKTVTSIRKFVKQIQYQFTADLKNKTPHIELIREIQKKLCPYTDPKKKNVQLPEWADLKERCRKAALDKIVSSKVEKPKIKEIALSGLKKKRKSRKHRKSSCR